MEFDEEFMVCQICNQLFDHLRVCSFSVMASSQVPFIIQCGHSLCSCCIAQAESMRGINLTCKYDSEQTSVRSLRNLIRNDTLLGLYDDSSLEDTLARQKFKEAKKLSAMEKQSQGLITQQKHPLSCLPLRGAIEALITPSDLLPTSEQRIIEKSTHGKAYKESCIASLEKEEAEDY